MRDRSRSAGARAREIGAKLRLRAAQGRDEAQAVVRRVTGELAGLADRAAAEAEKLLVNARRALPVERCAAPTDQPAKGRLAGTQIRRRGDGGGGCAAWSMT